MTKHVRTTLKYDGPALSGHEMDVQDLAPALLALADMIQIANKRFNGDHASIKVLVNADVEQKCFMIDISLVQSFLEQAKGFLGDDSVKTAKEIAEWIGILSGGGLGLFKLLKFIREAKQAQTPFQIENSSDGNITIIGNGKQITIPREVYNLALEPKMIEKAKAVMRPLEKEGYETLSFLENEREIFEVTKDEAKDISGFPDRPLSDIPTESVSHIRGQVRIKSAQYEGNAQWSFLWNGRAINAEMIDNAAEWVKHFQKNKVNAPPNSILDVTMTEKVQLDPSGAVVGKAWYAICEIHNVAPPPRQIGLFDDNPK